MEKKNTAPTMEQWAELYEVASAIKLQTPWEELWDDDLITIKLPGQEEPIFISVMGRVGECYGIGIYPGYRSINGFYRLMDSYDLDSPVNMLSFQNCLMCYFGSRDELYPKEREIIKSLGLKFRGANNWIYFRSMEEGFFPWFINAEQADLLIQVLQNFAMAYMHYSGGKIEVDFEGGETLMREYSAERDEWLNAAMPMPPIPEIIGNLIFKDEVLLRRLINKKKNADMLEIDILYLPMPIQDKADEAPHFPRFLVLMDHKNGELLAQDMLDVSIENVDAVCDMLINYIQENGKPSKLFIRDEYFLVYTESFCSQIGIPLTHNKGVPAIDNLAEGMSQFMDDM